MLDGEHEHSLTIQRDSLESTAAAASWDRMVTTAAASASAAKLLATLQQLQLSPAFARRCWWPRHVKATVLKEHGSRDRGHESAPGFLRGAARTTVHTAIGTAQSCDATRTDAMFLRAPQLPHNTPYRLLIIGSDSA